MGQHFNFHLHNTFCLLEGVHKICIILNQVVAEKTDEKCPIWVTKE